MGYKKLIILLTFLVLGCQLIRVVPQLPAEIPPPTSEVSAPAAANVESAPEAPPAEPTVTPIPGPTPIPEPTPTPTPTPYFLKQLSMSSSSEKALPRHGLLIVFILPLLVLGIPWMIIEFFVIRYTHPRGVDVAQVLIKAQDGLFVEARVSITARRTLTVASTTMTWPRVRDFVEKTVEQELIHAALSFPALEDLERNLTTISGSLKDLDIVRELSRDFGLEVLWFNIEIRYPQETKDALQTKAEASASGTAYLAYAAAAHLDPDTPECRELYRVFQETSGRVDAARNLGGGITNLADLLARKDKQTGEDQGQATSNK